MPSGGGTRCAVAICKNSTKKNINNPEKAVVFHRFPKNKATAAIWVQKCRRGDVINVQNARVCSEHFLEEDYERNLQAELLGLHKIKKLRPTAIPTEKLLSNEVEMTSPQKQQRRKRAEARAQRSLINEILAGTSKESEVVVKQEPGIEEGELMTAVFPTKSGTSHVLNVETQHPEYEKLLKKYEAVVKENAQIKNQLEMKSQLLNECQAKIRNLEQNITNLQAKFTLENACRVQKEAAVGHFLVKLEWNS